MADPAWSLETRRARVRAAAARSARRPARHVRRAAPQLERIQQTAIAIALHIDPLVGMIQLRRRTHAAARAARAALDNQPVPGAAADQAAFAFPKLPDLAGPVRQRYAAHAVTLALVGAIAAGFGSGASAPAPTRASQSSYEAAADLRDPQAMRMLSVEGVGGADAVDIPAIRGETLALQMPFLEVYQLAEGETLGDVARRFGVSAASLFWSNDLQHDEFLAAGRELRIPRVSGVPYVVVDGDTLHTVALKFGVAPEAIALFTANGIDASGELEIGREIFVPGGRQELPQAIVQQYGAGGLELMKAVAAGTVRDDETNVRSGPGRDYPRIGVLDAGKPLTLVARYEDWLKVDISGTGPGWVRRDLLNLSSTTVDNLPITTDFPPPPPVWVWPANGRITSRFGYRRIPFRSFHDGLDIANRAWTEIVAARRGVVIESGWCRGFGYCVKLDHGDGMTSIYGHLIKKPPVAAGTSVGVGEVIGYMGSTYDRSGGGYSTGVHLHFTVKVNGKPVDPLKFLP